MSHRYLQIFSQRQCWVRSTGRWRPPARRLRPDSPGADPWETGKSSKDWTKLWKSYGNPMEIRWKSDGNPMEIHGTGYWTLHDPIQLPTPGWISEVSQSGKPWALAFMNIYDHLRYLGFSFVRIPWDGSTNFLVWIYLWWPLMEFEACITLRIQAWLGKESGNKEIWYFE